MDQPPPPAASHPTAPSGQYSPDGRWYWDGTRWQAVPAARPAWARPYEPADMRATAAITLVGTATAGAAIFFAGEALDLAVVTLSLRSPLDVLDALVQVVAALIGLIGFAGAAVAVPMWMHRGYRNLPALGATGLSWSPRWAAGSWFIPFANLVVPYLVARELWTRSGPPGERPWPLLWLWWTAWIGAYALQFASNRAAAFSPAAGDVLGMVNDVATVVAGLLFIRFAQLVTRRQRERLATLTAAG